jgi:hypothetical protein
VRLDDRVADVAAVSAMADVMAWQGLDAVGVWSQDRVALAHRRLKIIDLSEAGSQPMVDAELGLTIAWNGCMYNYQDLRRELSGHGVPQGNRLCVRRTANLHQGGTIHDVTAQVNPELCRVAVTAAEAIGIPVTGIDLLVSAVTGTESGFIEANERPGLANHEPQPTAAAFVDFLFPGHPGQPPAWTAEESRPDRN